MKKLNIYYHPSTWQIKPHKGLDGQSYIQDMDIKPKWIASEIEQKLSNKVSLKFAHPLKWEDYNKTHDKKYVDKIINNDPEILKYSWITWSKSFLRAQQYVSGAIYESCKQALNKGFSGALVVEGHHAHRDKGAGLCTFNNLSVTITKLLNEGSVNKVAIVDLDLHFGDGTATIFKDDKRVSIFDLFGETHDKNIVPATTNGRINHYVVNTKDEFFSTLKTKLPEFLSYNKPELVIYVAGMDIYEGDRYGGLKGMDKKAILTRDKYVFKTIRSCNVPVSFTLGGGYVKYKSKTDELISPSEINKRRKRLAELHTQTIFALVNS